MSQANNPSAINSTEPVFSVPRQKGICSVRATVSSPALVGAEGFHELRSATGRNCPVKRPAFP
jgi:hypothetical protein